MYIEKIKKWFKKKQKLKLKKMAGGDGGSQTLFLTKEHRIFLVLVMMSQVSDLSRKETIELA